VRARKGRGPAARVDEQRNQGEGPVGRSLPSSPQPNQSQLFHPLADIFPLIEDAELDELAADIKANGLREPVVLFEGKILDGRNRYRACAAAGVDCRFETHKGDEPVAYVVSLNLHRRHLTRGQKRELIAKLVKAQPEKSDRQIAKAAKVHHETVGAARAELEGRGEIRHVEKRTDTKGRKQPAEKKATTPAKSVPSQVERELAAKQAHIDELHDRNNDLAEQLRAAEIKIVGLESEIADLKRENADLRQKLEAAS
jgi:ParB-like chromosome segregation protein Spo0J